MQQTLLRRLFAETLAKAEGYGGQHALRARR